MITVVGLGTKQGDLTIAGKEALLSAKRVVVRTENTPSFENVKTLGILYETLDGVYQSCRSFRTLYKKLADAVYTLSKDTDVVYAVDGSGAEDNSVKELLKKTHGKLRIVSGISKTSALADFIGFKNCSYESVSAYELTERASLHGLHAPLIVYDIDDKSLAVDCKLALTEYFGEERTIFYVCHETKKKIKLYELDRQKVYDGSCGVCIEDVPLIEKQRFTLEDVHELIVRLRAPDGCPWDKVQTSESLKMSAVDEAYELLDALNKKDDDKIKEESGDLLMQSVFHAVLKEEEGAFSLSDVLSELGNKLISRHTHVFGKDKAKSAEEALKVWDKNKMVEKGQDTFFKAIDDVPRCYPALMQAQKVAKRLEKGGWGYADFEAVEKELFGELEELKSAVKTGDEKAVKDELGDVLMYVVELSRKVHADSEEALLDTVEKVKRRYEAFEKFVLQDGKDVLKLTDAEWNGYYKKAKTATAKK